MAVLEAKNSDTLPTINGDFFVLAGNENTGAVYVETKNSTVPSSVSFTRPNNTTAYSAGSVVGSTTGSTAALPFSGIGAAGKVIRITGTRLEIDVASIPTGMTSFRLHLYNSAPPSALGDNASWALPSGDRASYLGYVDLGSPSSQGGTLYVQSTGLDVDVVLGATTSLFGYLTTIGGYTPTASVVKVVTLYAMGM
jgi:hypothetical protein